MDAVEPSAPVEIVALDDAGWARFVAGRPEATCFHRPEWAAMLADCYRYRGFALVVRGADSAVLAGLPVVEVRSPARTRRWICLPFSDECGPLAGDRAQALALLEAADRMRRRRGVADLVVRSAGPPGVPATQVAVTHTLPLGGAQGERPRPRASVRRAIAAADRSGVRVRAAQTSGDLADVFYGLHLSTRRRQGVPVQPRRYFRLLWEHMIEPGHGFVLLAEARGMAVAGAVYLTGGETVTYKYGASDDRAWPLRPNHAVMARAIARAVDEGYAFFDFGRTDLDNPGLIRFKETWGATARPLMYTSFSGETSYASARRPRAMLAPLIRRSPDIVCRGLGELLYRYAA
jgi:CelD/BcsL family acetyltransferase involved in cellulose biosynthesis